MRADRVVRRIGRAGADGRLTRVTRRPGWDRLDGSVLASSATWVLLAVEHDAGFSGHTLVRVADVRRVDDCPSPEFLRRALAAEGHWPLPRLDGIDLSSTRRALASLAATGSLVTVHYERDHPDECLIGIPWGFGRKKFRLQTVDPDATWDAARSVLRYRSITRIEVGGAYERRLAAVAGPPPPRPSSVDEWRPV